MCGFEVHGFDYIFVAFRYLKVNVIYIIKAGRCSTKLRLRDFWKINFFYSIIPTKLSALKAFKEGIGKKCEKSR